MSQYARCGTPSGYNKHQENDEKPCDACALAKKEYDQRWKAAPDRVKKSRLYAKAQNRALKDLRHAHLEEYEVLYEMHRNRIKEEEDL